MPKKLTSRQKSVYSFIASHIVNEHSAPTYEEISTHFGHKSPNGAGDAVKTLIKKGWLIKRKRGCSSSYKLANVKITIEDLPSE